MSWDYLPKRDRMPAPSEANTPSQSEAMKELARRARAHKRTMSILGKCLFASALGLEPQAVPVGRVIVSVDPFAVRASKAKPSAKVRVVDADLDLL